MKLNMISFFKKLIGLFATIVMLSSGLALGGMDFKFIGFSEDGSYLAFEQYGIQDGSGFAQSEIFVVDVDDNTYVVAPFEKTSQDDESQSLEQIRSQNLIDAQATLDLVGIVEGNTGQQVVNRLATDLFADSQNVYFPKRPVLALYRYKVDDSDYAVDNDYYHVSLNSMPTANLNCDFNDDLGYPAPAILSMTLRDAESNQVQVLQQDTSLPESRGCAFEYVIREVYHFQRISSQGELNKVAVFLNSYQPGFEGPDSKWLVVTGEIEVAANEVMTVEK